MAPLPFSNLSNSLNDFKESDIQALKDFIMDGVIWSEDEPNTCEFYHPIQSDRVQLVDDNGLTSVYRDEVHTHDFNSPLQTALEKIIQEIADESLAMLQSVQDFHKEFSTFWNNREIKNEEQG